MNYQERYELQKEIIKINDKIQSTPWYKISDKKALRYINNNFKTQLAQLELDEILKPIPTPPAVDCLGKVLN